jgi:hypothetical protein
MTAFLGIDLTGHMSAGDLLVGLGTLALAGTTAWLAHRTSQEVGLTETSVFLTRESIEAIDRPFVVPTPHRDHAGRGIEFEEGEFSYDDPDQVLRQWHFYLRLWNIGKGPAIVDSLELINGEREFLSEAERLLEVPVGAGEASDQAAMAPHGPPEADATLMLRVCYRSGSGRRYSTTSTIRTLAGPAGRIGCVATDFTRVEIG